MLIFALLYEVISLNAYDGVELKDKTRQRRHIKVKNIDFIFLIKVILLLKLRYFLNYLKTPMRLKVS